jgi:diguanylate cyclase (GGDEF)-like protein
MPQAEVPVLLYAVAGGLVLVVSYLLFRLLKLSASHRKTSVFRHAADSLEEGLLILRPISAANETAVEWMIEDCNRRGTALCRHAPAEAVGLSIGSLYSGDELRQFREACDWALEYGDYEDEYTSQNPAPAPLTKVRRRIRRQSDRTLVVSLLESSAAGEFENAMQRLANEDAVTTLPNRNWLVEHLPSMLQDTGSKCALLFIDLDDFRNVNDALGHSVGDLLLRVTAMRLKSVVSKHDHVVRLGGDEFAIVLNGVSGKGQAKQTAQLVNEILHFPLELVSGRRSMTTSIGISVFPDDALDMETLLRTAEIAMYAAKQDGKAGHRFYRPELSEILKDRLNLEQELLAAIEQDQFILYFEPRMNIRTSHLAGMEALVRWNHPERGLVSPHEFIPIAESTGLIIQLGELVIDKAFRQIRAWTDANLQMVPLAINISGRQLNSGALGNLFAEKLLTYALRPELVQIELTESVMLGDQASVVDELARIRGLGIQLLIDDFGTGYSSLSQLQRLKLDVLKIDRAFLAELDHSRESQVFVKAIISMAHALDMTVVAEGVETKQQMTILRTLSCDEAQGYILSRPMPADAASALLRQDEIMQFSDMLLP